MDEPLTFGRSTHLQFELRWEAASPSGTAADATRGTLVARVGGRTVWGAVADAPEGFKWTWVELVEHLAHQWGYIFLEEGDPLGLDVPIERLRAKAEERWGGATEDQQAREEELLWVYFEAHDLASSLQGAFPTSLWMTREGSRLRVACKGIVAYLSLDEARATLTALGDAIVERLTKVDDERAASAMYAWKTREAIDPERLSELATGLEPEALASLKKASGALQPRAFVEAFRSDEYLAVARMTSGSLPADELARLLAILRTQSHTWTGPIDKLAEGAAGIVSGIEDKPPFEQGRAVARWFRARLNVADEHRIEPADILADWKVDVTDVRLASRDLDAVSVWGPKHGPAIIVNRSGRHGRMNGRRATLAHEIGHLLMDRREALPLAEVIGGRVSSRVEMRARAFAAELLVPEKPAGEAIVEAKDTKELHAIVSRLSEWYGASTEIVAWQAANAHDRRLPSMMATYLKSLVSNPQAF